MAGIMAEIPRFRAVTRFVGIRGIAHVHPRTSRDWPDRRSRENGTTA
jgi:hypothetical protein